MSICCSDITTLETKNIVGSKLNDQKTIKISNFDLVLDLNQSQSISLLYTHKLDKTRIENAISKSIDMNPFIAGRIQQENNEYHLNLNNKGVLFSIQSHNAFDSDYILANYNTAIINLRDVEKFTDIQNGSSPLMQISILKLIDESFILTINSTHILDGMSMGEQVKLLTKCYNDNNQLSAPQNHMGYSIEEKMKMFTKSLKDVPGCKYHTGEQASFTDQMKIGWFFITHDLVQMYQNFTNEIIDLLRKRQGSFQSKFDLLMSLYWKFLMINNQDKDSLLMLVLNARNRFEFIDKHSMGTSTSFTFVEGHVNCSIEELGQKIRSAINQFTEDQFLMQNKLIEEKRVFTYKFNDEIIPISQIVNNKRMYLVNDWRSMCDLNLDSNPNQAIVNDIIPVNIFLKGLNNDGMMLAQSISQNQNNNFIKYINGLLSDEQENNLEIWSQKLLIE